MLCCQSECFSPFLEGQKLSPDSLRVAASLAKAQQWVQDGVNRASVQASQLQRPVGYLPQLKQSILGADLMLAVVKVAFHRREVKPVTLLCLRRNLDLEIIPKCKIFYSLSSTHLLEFNSCKAILI